MYNFFKKTNIRTTILLLIPGTLWGFLYLVNDIALDTIPPFMFTALRNMLTAIALVIIIYGRGERLVSTWSAWRPYLFLGLVDNAMPFVLISWGQLYIDSGLTTILLSLVPLFTVFLAYFFSSNETLNRQKVFGIVLGLLGIVILVGPHVLDGVDFHLWGQLAVIGGSLSYAIAAIYVRLHLQHEEQSGISSVLKVFCSQFLCSLVFILPLAIVIDQPWTIEPSQASVMALLISSWLITIGAGVAYYYLINLVGASSASSTLYLTPINGVFWGAVLLSESVTWPIIIALILVLSGVALINHAT